VLNLGKWGRLPGPWRPERGFLEEIRMHTLLRILISVSLLATAGCAPSAPTPEVAGANATPGPATGQPTPGVTDTEVVLGTWMPLTGPASAWSAIGRTYDAYFKMVNERGGIHGRQVRVILEDDSYSPAKTVPLVRRMVEQDQVFAFLGGLGTPSGSAVLDYIVQQGVPHIAPSTGSSKWSDPVKPGYYAWQINYKTEARILTNYGVETLGKQTFAVFYQNDDYGKEGLEEAKAQLAQRGAQLVDEVAYNVTDTDYSAHALRLKESGAEAVLTWPSVKQFGSLLQEAGRIGFKPVWLSSATVNDPSLLKLAPEDVQGAYFVGYLPNPDDPASANVSAVQEWKENLPKYGPDLPLSKFTLYGWGQGRLMSELLNRAGRELTREGLEQAAQTLSNWQDLATVTYTATDRRGITVGWIEQAQGDAIVKITEPIAAD
jgi:branched-chain amino acid transport system substrate-binding protein